MTYLGLNWKQYSSCTSSLHFTRTSLPCAFSFVTLLSYLQSHLWNIFVLMVAGPFSGSVVEIAEPRICPLVFRSTALWTEKSAVVTNTNFHTEGVKGFDPPSSVHVKVRYALQRERSRKLKCDPLWNVKLVCTGLMNTLHGVGGEVKLSDMFITFYFIKCGNLY